MEDLKRQLVELRHDLHQNAERSEQEEKTAGTIRQFLEPFSPDEVHSGLGGHGLAAVFRGQAAGPAVLIRADLDALPIPESIELEYASRSEGTAHKCGHDGHMAMAAGVAALIAENRPHRGSVILLFQPAEEIGQGARWVLDDPAFAPVKPDYVFALHNLPGFPTGHIILREGVFASASKGLVVRLTGATSHAAEPDRGRSPALAVAQMITALSAAPQFFTQLHEAAQATVIHARVGEVAFGTSPGVGEVMATLRAHSQEVMDALAERSLEVVKGIADAYRLDSSVEWVEEFPSTVNDPECVGLLRAAAGHLGLKTVVPAQPFPWSEDFGNFTAASRGALFGLGAGEDTPALHNPDYDFPDQLIGYGLAMYAEIIHRLLGLPETGHIKELVTATG